jgi:hypothetical protein
MIADRVAIELFERHAGREIGGANIAQRIERGNIQPAGGPQQARARRGLQLAPERVGGARQHHVVEAIIRQPDDPGWPVRAAAIVPNHKLIEEQRTRHPSPSGTPQRRRSPLHRRLEYRPRAAHYVLLSLVGNAAGRLGHDLILWQP